MVTIKAQTSPQNAARYFREHLSRDDYYSERESTLGHWFGRTCEFLGIKQSSAVQQEQFVSLCKGFLPDTRTRLTQRRTSNRRCLYDLTVSAPKSVSIMALVGGDERLIAAHERAVAATLDAAEKLAQVRVRKGPAVDTKDSRTTGNIIAAQFLHRESRALDPQLHTHCVVFNVTHDLLEKRLKALEVRQVYDRSKELTRLYRDHLTSSLHVLGYDTYLDRHRCVQIRGVETGLLGRFSKRSAQRDALIALKEESLGRGLSKSEVAVLIHKHRDKKQRHADSKALRQAHLNELTPAERASLEKLRATALTNVQSPQPRSLSSSPTSATCPKLDWIAMVRFALLATRTLRVNPYLFTPQLSFSERVIQGGRVLQHVQRTRSFLRYAQLSRSNEISP